MLTTEPRLTVYLDLDGVLADFVTGALRHLHNNHGSYAARAAFMSLRPNAKYPHFYKWWEENAKGEYDCFKVLVAYYEAVRDSVQLPMPPSNSGAEELKEHLWATATSSFWKDLLPYNGATNFVERLIQFCAYRDADLKLLTALPPLDFDYKHRYSAHQFALLGKHTFIYEEIVHRIPRFTPQWPKTEATAIEAVNFEVIYLSANNKHLFANPHSILIDDSHELCRKFENAGGRAIEVPRPWNSRTVDLEWYTEGGLLTLPTDFLLDSVRLNMEHILKYNLPGDRTLLQHQNL